MTQRAWWSLALAVRLMWTNGAEPWSSPGVACAIGWQPEQFTLAIVRPDGRLVPFAASDGGRWVKAWPEADEQPGGTPTLDNVPSVWRARGDPVPLVWQVWPATGVSSIQAHVKGVGNVDAHCGLQAALTPICLCRESRRSTRSNTAWPSIRNFRSVRLRKCAGQMRSGGLPSARLLPAFPLLKRPPRERITSRRYANRPSPPRVSAPYTGKPGRLVPPYSSSPKRNIARRGFHKILVALPRRS